MSDVTLTDAEAAEVDWFMSEHMYRHTVSNSPNSWSCDVGCRTRALGRALSPVLAARLSQERERAVTERDRESVPGVGVWEALADEYERRRDNLRRRSEADSRRTADCMDRREANTWDVAASEIRGRLTQDGPRPAQEGQR